ncbi:MAG TPA: succinyl-diaminopimelate desuccinylase [Rhizobiales bacterium]|nr:succinyl-diaminopimelate desuccinylase [bacterium BMS3Bbin10]HDO51499.1 succinyl-diaminopimelate desuccinylase [Hyphomicrobiales bacterium]
MAATPLEIAQALIRCPSVTPQEGGALDLLQGLLEAEGFTCHRLPFSDKDTPGVDNLFARIGTGAPHLCFAGHTDVVPPGDDAAWSHPPFGGQVVDGWLYGRGAADMKGNIACFVAAICGYLDGVKGDPPGSVSFLITGDEEGPAINGTRKVLEWMAAGGHTPDHCLVGEPSSSQRIGDTVRVGRRGSLSGHVTVTGVQGHTAYPHLANNPVPGMLGVLGAFLAEPLDDGAPHFSPSDLQIAAIDTGNPATNVIPARISASFNIRFNSNHSADHLKEILTRKAGTALEGSGLSHQIDFLPASPCFIAEPGPLIDHMVGAVQDETGQTPQMSTGGGTSDARFVKDYCPVIEFGLVNQTIHQVDERIEVGDLEALTRIYRAFVERYFAAFATTGT